MTLTEINWRPDRRRLRRFGTICLIAFAAVGAWIYFRHAIFGFELTARAARNTAYLLWIVAALCGVLRVAAPAGLQPLYVALTAITLPIGFVLSHVVIGALFYGVLTPIGLVMRLTGRDPLCRAFDREAKTYWVIRKPTTDAKRYFRQF